MIRIKRGIILTCLSCFVKALMAECCDGNVVTEVVSEFSM